MKNAGMSIIKSFKLLPDKTITKLEKLSKLEKSIKVGLIRKNDREFSREFGRKMKEVVHMFVEQNEINRGKIISIKNDAVFVADVNPTITKFYECEFIAKNRYTSYVNLDGKEFYYGNDNIDVKGFGQEILDAHNPYMISLIGGILKSAENLKSNKLLELFKTVQGEYLNMDLDIEYYREMNSDLSFKLKSEGNMIFGVQQPFDGITEYLDISFNYHYILMMIKAMI
jgi:hypothetical protein